MEKEDVFAAVGAKLHREPYEVERLVWPFVVAFVAQWMRRYVANGEQYARLWLEDVGVDE